MDFNKELSEVYPWILAVARRYCRSRQDAEDLAGETVYKMLSNRDKFDCSKSLKIWGFVLLHNTYITIYNKKSMIPFVSYDIGLENCFSCSSSDLTLFRDAIATIRRCLRKSNCIDCVIYFAKGYSYEEISDFLNIPIGTVKSRISYGRKQLYQEMNL